MKCASRKIENCGDQDDEDGEDNECKSSSMNFNLDRISDLPDKKEDMSGGYAGTNDCCTVMIFGTEVIFSVQEAPQKAIQRRYKELMEPQVQKCEPRPLTMEERKKGYIQQTRVRRNGVTDKYYYHVETDQKFRSLKAVHEYILFGDHQHGSFSEKIYKGTTYLESQAIGRCNFKTKSIMPIEEQIDDSGVNIDEEDMSGGYAGTNVGRTIMIFGSEVIFSVQEAPQKAIKRRYKELMETVLVQSEVRHRLFDLQSDFILVRKQYANNLHTKTGRQQYHV